MNKVEELVEKFSKCPGYLKKGPDFLANKFNCTEDEVKEAKRIVRKGSSLDEFLVINDIDKSQVKKAKVWQNFEGSPLYSVELTSSNKEWKEEFFNSLAKYKAPELKSLSSIPSEVIAVLNLYDAHLDKLCLLSEANSQNTLQDNVDSFESAFDEMLTAARNHAPEYIVIPVGNDFFNTNGTSNATKRGTPQDTLVKHQEAFIEGFKTLRRCIDKAAQCSKVVVMTIKGNHDEDPTFYLGEILNAIYESNPNVIVECSRHQRKYFRYGTNLLGFAHGDKECKNVANLPLMMAEEKKEDWAVTKYREWFLGDRHHKFEFKFMRTKDFIGATVRFLRSVGTSDKWHYDHGYLGIPRTGEVYIYDKVKGPRANYLIHLE